MIAIKQIFRLLQINYILAKNGLDNLIVSIKFFSMFRFLIYINPWNWFRDKRVSRGVALRKSLEELGPIFVKFGQALSTRPDFIPEDIVIELCKLQDNVPPFKSGIALEIIEKAFGKSAHEVFAKFDESPLASASIAQVHAATLKTGEEVVVKILRPDIKKIILKDIKILKTIANFADKYWPASHRLKPKEIVKEFERTILDELDLMREAANGSQLRRNFKDSKLLYIPAIYWDYTSQNIFVMERIYGIPISNIAKLKQHNVNLKKLGEVGLEIFFTQVFRDCFFHADMHPGNIFVSYDTPQSPKYICVDFGIIGTLNDNDKHYIAENLLAFFNRDYKKIAKLHMESGWIDKHARENEFESAIRTVCEPIFEKPLKDISFAVIMLRLFQVARRFKMEVQPQLVLLQKTLFAVEGLGRQVYPELNLWTNAKPFLEKWLKERVGFKSFISHIQDNAPFYIEQLPYMPKLLNDTLLNLKEQKSQSLISRHDNLPKKYFKWYRGVAAGVFIVSTTVVFVVFMNWLDKKDLMNFLLGASLVSGIFSVCIKSRG